MRYLFDSWSFTFTGATKKVAYEGLMEGVPVVPVQAITAVVFTLIGLVGTWLFLNSYFVAALLVAMTATQAWRFVSERLRADLRGKAEKISAYQVMALLMIVYVVAMAWLFAGGPALAVELGRGLQTLWHPAALLFCQALWLVVFFITGRSRVTGATLSFFVHHDRV